MTASDRMDIPSPADGLMVYQTDDVQGFYYYDGSAWSVFVNSNQITDFGSGMVITDEERTTLGNAVLSNAGFPAMTYAERNAMTDVFEGMIIYQSDNTKGLRVFDGSAWSLVTPKVVFLTDVKSPDDNGGSSVTTGWNKRDLNTIEGNKEFCSLSGNEFVLEPGTYLIEAQAPAYRVHYHQLRLFDASNDAIAKTSDGRDFYGNGNYNAQTNEALVVSYAELMGEFTVSSATSFQLDHWTRFATATNGLGVHTSGDSGETPEIYTMIKITKISD